MSLLVFPLDIWFNIVEYLHLCDLCSIYYTFVSNDLRAIATTQMTKVLYGYLASGEVGISISIKSDGKPVSRPCRHPPDSKHHQHCDIGGKTKQSLSYVSPVKKESIIRRFASGSSTRVEMEFSATDLEVFSSIYMPLILGMQPTEPSGVQITLSSPAWHETGDGTIQLHYAKGRIANFSNVVKDTYLEPATMDRFLAGDLQLKSVALCKKDLRKYEPPRILFNLLKNVIGEKIRVSAIFRKSMPASNFSEEYWTSYGFLLRTVLISFENISRPSSKSLLRLFPPEIADR